MLEYKPKNFPEAVALYLLGYEDVRHQYGELVFSSPDAGIYCAVEDYYAFRFCFLPGQIWRAANFLRSL